MSDVPEATPVDLDRFSEALRRWLYDRVVQIQFGLQDSATAYTPDEAGLQVVRLGGRWFALWSDPNQAPTLPTSLRLQIVRIETSREHPLDIELHAV
jgi:hypothetical protein